MARTYWVRAPATCADGDSFDAWTTRQRIQKNLESVYEEARIDQCVILQAPDLTVTTLTPAGPFAIWMRRDRDQSWRTPQIQILAAGGTANITFRACLTPSYRRPAGGAPPDELPYKDIAVGAGVVPAWIAATSFSVPWWWDPERRELPEGDELGSHRIAWLTLWTTKNPAGPAYPMFCGFRTIETVDDEP
jgi:hypothetical protein